LINCSNIFQLRQQTVGDISKSNFSSLASSQQATNSIEHYLAANSQKAGSANKQEESTASGSQSDSIELIEQEINASTSQNDTTIENGDNSELQDCSNISKRSSWKSKLSSNITGTSVEQKPSRSLQAYPRKGILVRERSKSRERKKSVTIIQQKEYHTHTSVIVDRKSSAQIGNINMSVLNERPFSKYVVLLVMLIAILPAVILVIRFF